MKTKLTFLLAAFVLFVLQLQPAQSRAAVPPAEQQCAAFCATVRCIGEKICGLYVNSSGQTVCGCHDRPIRP
jgi:hypothetical protein